MEMMERATITGSWLNTSYRDVQGGTFGEWDLYDFAQLDAPESIAAGGTRKHALTTRDGEVLVTETAWRW